MRPLVLVFIVCVVLLLWAAWAIARAVRRHGKAEATQLRDKPKEPEDH